MYADGKTSFHKQIKAKIVLASHAGVFRGARFHPSDSTDSEMAKMVCKFNEPALILFLTYYISSRENDLVYCLATKPTQCQYSVKMIFFSRRQMTTHP